MHESLLFILAGIVVLSFICQWFAWWIRLPSILFLLIVGIAIGPFAGWLQPDKLFGDLLTPIVELSVAIILFEGSLSLNTNNIRGHFDVVGSLLTIGVIITVVCATFLSHWLFALPFNVAILFAVIICVSGPTVVTPLLRAVRPKEKLANILHWESIIIDPIGALLAILVFNFVVVYYQHASIWESLLLFFLRIIISGAIGIGIGYFCGVILRKHWLPDYLQNVATLAFVLLSFALGNHFEDGSGLLTVTVMGILLANMRDVHIADILDFKESLSILLISGTFLILAARVNFTHLHAVIWSALIFLACLQFLVRPLSIFCCTVLSSLKLKDKILLAWICPRGIVCAAISAIFAIRLQQLNIHGFQQIVLLTFLVIIGTVVFQSLTTKPLAKLLGLAEEKNKGFLIIGANVVARTFAKALMEHHIRVKLVTPVWDYAQAARMEGLPVFFGSPVSNYADRHLNLIGLSGMLAVSSRSSLNSLAALRYKRDFGSENIYCVQGSNSNDVSDKHSVSEHITQNTLFADGITYRDLNRILSQDADIKTTKLTEEYPYEQFEKDNPDAILLFAFDPKNVLHIFTTQKSVTPDKDWSVVYLNN